VARGCFGGKRSGYRASLWFVSKDFLPAPYPERFRDGLMVDAAPAAYESPLGGDVRRMATATP
jgi:hypothetical protein